MALIPKVMWAQRKDVVFLTIDLQDVKTPAIDISNDTDGKYGKITFKGEGRSHATGLEKHQYSLELELFKVSSACSKHHRMLTIPIFSNVLKFQ